MATLITYIDCDDVRHCKESCQSSSDLCHESGAMALLFLAEISKPDFQLLGITYMARSCQSEYSTKSRRRDFRVDILHISFETQHNDDEES